MYYIYILRCKDNTLYTGITVDVKRRMEEHFSRNDKCAKYTYTHIPKKLEIVWETENKSLASKLEYAIKKLTKAKKEELVRTGRLEEVICSNKVEVEKYSCFWGRAKKTTKNKE